MIQESCTLRRYRENSFWDGQIILEGAIRRCSYLYKQVFCKGYSALKS